LNTAAGTQVRPTLILTRADIASLMAPQDYLEAVEAGFRSYAGGHFDLHMPMHIAAGAGSFHAKGARLMLDREYVALKFNANFPSNPRINGLPTIQGVLTLCDAG